MAVVIPLKLVYTPVDATVTAIRNYQVPSTKVTGAAADEYNLNVVDCNASVTVARRSSISVSGGLGGTVTLDFGVGISW